MDVVAVVGTVSSVVAAYFAFLAWDSTRERHPFRLSPLSDRVIVVTRTSRIPAHLDGIGVTHHQPLMATDDRATIPGRVLKRYQFVALEVPESIQLPVGETLAVHYHCWPRRSVRRKWLAPILSSQ